MDEAGRRESPGFGRLWAMVPAMGKRQVALVVLVLLVVAAITIRSTQTPDTASPSADAAAPPSASAVPYLPQRFAPHAPAPMSVVEPVLFSLRPKLKECYLAASKSQPELRGQAVFTVSIGADGKVTDVVPLSHENLDTALLSCVSNALRSGVFPPPPDGQPSSINVPLSFAPTMKPIIDVSGADAAAPDASP